MEAIKNILQKLKNAQFLKRSDHYLTPIIIIGLLIVINFLAAQIFFRLDLTANGDYSISKSSKNAAAKLDDVVNIKTYFSKNLPAKYLILEQAINDILSEYSNYSNGKIVVKEVDPAALSDAQKELGAKGIPTLQFNVLRNDSFQVVNGYLGLEIQYGGKSEVLPVISDMQNLEYQITSALKKLTAKELSTIGLVTSNGAVKAADSAQTGETIMSQANKKLAELYKIKPIDLAKDNITDDVSTLLIVGPKEKFTDEELKKIDAFVMKGKSLILLVDGVRIVNGMTAEKNDIGLDKLLSAYGLKLNNDLIYDVDNSGRASFSSNSSSYTMTYVVNYPLWPKILPNNMDKTNVMVANLQSLIFPWASSITATPAAGESVLYLAKTTSQSRQQVDNFILDPKSTGSASDPVGQYPLAVFASGKVSSAFGNGSTDKARIILVGDSDFATDLFSGAGSDNMLFFQNIVDGLTLDNDLINIRAKSATERPIKMPEQKLKEVMRYANIFGITILVLAFGFFRYFMRRRNKMKKSKKTDSSSI